MDLSKLEQEKKDILLIGLDLANQMLRSRAIGTDENLKELQKKLEDVKKLEKELGKKIKRDDQN